MGYRGDIVDNCEDKKLEGTITLDDLKRENAKELEAAAEDTATSAVESDSEAVEEESLSPEQSAETEEGQDIDSEIEAWMEVADEQGSADERTFTGGDIAAAKKKLRAKLDKAHNAELEELRSEIERLKQPQPQMSAESSGMPSREDYDYDEGRYQAAVQQWLDQQVVMRVAQASQYQSQSAAQQQAQQHLAATLDGHYERAAQLAQDSGIKPDDYRAADHAVRQAIDSVSNGQGDAFTDQFISRIGDGSEKVMYYLGRNASARETLISHLATDPTGLTASIYLGELKASVATPRKQVSRAPKPATTASGDVVSSDSANARSLQKKYAAAHKKGGGQEAYNIRKQAREAGIDVSNW